MGWSELINMGITLMGVIVLALLLYFYFTKQAVKKTVDGLLKYIPSVLDIAKGFVKDKPGKFDAHDALELMSRITSGIKDTIDDPVNKTFEDVEEEVFEIVRRELAYYRNLPGVPDVDDPVLKAQVKVVFDNVQWVMRENPE